MTKYISYLSLPKLLYGGIQKVASKKLPPSEVQFPFFLIQDIAIFYSFFTTNNDIIQYLIYYRIDFLQQLFIFCITSSIYLSNHFVQKSKKLLTQSPPFDFPLHTFIISPIHLFFCVIVYSKILKNRNGFMEKLLRS